jgi:hypothetical protein
VSGGPLQWGRIRLWGFEVVAGRYVGGGLFQRVALGATEGVDDAFSCGRESWFGPAGYLVLTDLRLIYVPYRWPLSIVPVSPAMIEYANVEDCRLEMRRSPQTLSSFLAPAVVVVTTGGQQHVFWPAIMEREAVVRYIRTRSADRDA